MKSTLHIPGKFNRIVILPLFFLFAFGNLGGQTFTLQESIPLDPKVRTGVLPNGMKYYIQKNTKPQNRAELRLAVNAGSMQEDENQQGLAHFCEHMAFNGTKHFKKNELVDYLESIGTKFGAHLNAYTSFDETVYMIQIPTDNQEIVDKGFLILQDWANGLSFDPAEIDKERGVVIEEWRLGQGADERMRKKYFPILFKNSRYADRLPIGKKEILESFKPETLINFYKKWYRTDLMSVVVVGDFADLDAIETKIKTEFGAIPATPNPAPRISYPVPDPGGISAAVVRDKEAPMTGITLYYHHPKHEIKTTADLREEIILELSSRMINQRFEEFSLLPDPPFIFGFGYHGSMVREKSGYIIFGAVQPQNIQKGLEVFLTENERVARHGFIETELERAKASILKEAEQDMKALETTESRQIVMNYVYHFLENEPAPGGKWDFEIRKQLLPGITLSEVNEASKKRITRENIVAIITAPEKDEVKVPTESEVIETIKRFQGTEVQAYVDKTDDSPLLPKEPTPGKILSENKIQEIGLTELKLSNGIKVLLKPTDFDKSKVFFSGSSPGGMSKADDKDFASVNMAAEIVGASGLGKFNQSVLTKKLAGKEIYIYPFIRMYREGFGGECESGEIETLLKMVHLYFTNPRIDKDACEGVISKTRGWLETSRNDPETAFQDTFSFVSKGRHPKFKPMDLFDLDKVNQQKAYQFFIDRFSDPFDFSFLFVGDFKENEIRPLLEKYLGSIPTFQRQENWKDPGIPFPKGKEEVIVKRGTEPKSLVNISIQGPIEASFENEIKINAICGILKITLREALREEKGGTYFVIANPSYELIPKPQYSITLGFGCSPENVEMLTETLWQKIRELKNEGPGEKNLSKVKEMARREQETNLKDNRWWARTLDLWSFYGRDAKDLLRKDNIYEKLTEKDVQDAAKKYLDEENYVKVVLMPQ